MILRVFAASGMAGVETTGRTALGLKVVVAGHKPYWVPDDPAYVAVQAGATGCEPIPGFRRDDSGDNISAKNRGYCELTALYWAWRNLEHGDLGLAHYRRHFASRRFGPARSRVATGVELADVMSHHSVVLPSPRDYFIETNWSQYAHAHHEGDLVAARDVVAGYGPGMLAKFDEVMTRTRGHRFNMFVMRGSVADEWCSWLFGTLAELEGRIDTTGYSANDARVFGFLAERLLDVWIESSGLGYVEMPVVNLEGQNWPRKGAAFLRRKYQDKLSRSGL